MGKKKATGMSKRLGFTDRATITENKDILRYNERLEREAQGLPPEEPRRRAPRTGGRPEGGRAQGGDVQRARPAGARPPRQPRPPRPPALDDEQIAILVTAYQAAVGESGLEPAADKVIERIGAHDSFERATMAGWEIAAGGHAGERTAPEWELLRSAWLTVRMALLEAYATFTPEAAEALAREQKQQARLAKPPRPRRRPGKGPDKRRPARSPAASGPRTPSPADVARHVAAHGSTPEEATAALTAEPVREPSSGVEPSPEVAPSVVPSAEEGEAAAMSNDGADPETDVALPDASAPATDDEGDHTGADPLAGPDDPAEPDRPDTASAEQADEHPASDHEPYRAATDDVPPADPDDGQLALEL